MRLFPVLGSKIPATFWPRGLFCSYASVLLIDGYEGSERIVFEHE
jgi:hypothetical protein